MAYAKKTWLQRIVSLPGRRRLTSTGTEDVYDMSRAEGEIIQEGDAWSAANMNDMEDRIESGLDEKLDKAKVVEDLNVTEEGYALGAKTGGEAIAALNDAFPSMSKMQDYKTLTSVTNCTCSSFKYVKFGNILFFTAGFTSTVATPSTYAIRFTLPYAIREALFFSTMASGGGANDVVAYGNMDSNFVTVNIHGTHATGYGFYVQGYTFVDD